MNEDVEGKGNDYARDPVHQHDGKWWHWNETWANRCGPYDTEVQARRALYNYALALGKRVIEGREVGRHVAYLPKH